MCIGVDSHIGERMIAGTCLAGDCFVKAGQERGHLGAGHGGIWAIGVFANTSGDTEVVDARRVALSISACGKINERVRKCF